MRDGRVDDDTVDAAAFAAKAGDPAAATAFVRATHAEVHRFLCLLVDAREAEDLTQETYLRALRALPGFAARSTARTWLLAIARRVAADHLRVQARRPRHADLVDWQYTADTVTAGRGGPALDEQVALRALLVDLPAERRAAFVATQLLGLSYEETAQVCDCPVGTVRSRVARAREDLVAALRPAPPRHRSSALG